MPGRSGKAPNFLIILTDEERYPVPEETEELRQFRDKYLPARKELLEKGIVFHNHYTAATACTPSRASLFTGHYPSLHGVTETYGLAKNADDPRIQWLEPHTIPTMGNIFREAGYETVYKGKWHISKADIMKEDGEELETIDEHGKRIPEAERAYLERQPLAEFGFSDWIGPEPHGVKLENGGINRDPSFSEQVVEYLEEREHRVQSGEETRPFLLVTSLVNPHDIALFPQFKSLGMDLSDETVPHIPPAPTDDEDLHTKPSPQGKFRKAFEHVFCAPEIHQMLFANREELRRMYYYLHKFVDKEIGNICSQLKNTSFYEDTIVILTSDHGDMLGSHGGLLQKWTVAYQEAIKIPLIFSAPFLSPATHDFVTSSVDLLPTMLGLAGLSSDALLRSLARSHSEVHPLVGNDFSAVLKGELSPETQYGQVALFMTEDEVTKGNSQVSIRGSVEYDAVDGPTSIDAIVGFVENRKTGERELWKYVRYHDNPQKWTHPLRKDITIIRQGPMRGRIIVHTECYPEEFELYNLSRDPHELDNLAHPAVLDRLSPEAKQEVVHVALHMASKLSTISAQRKIAPNHPRARRAITPSYVLESKL